MYGIWNTRTARWLEGSDRLPLGFTSADRAQAHADAGAPADDPKRDEARPLPEGTQISKEIP